MRIIAILFALAALAARAEGPRNYAIVSLVGDEIVIVAPAMTTGTSLDRSSRSHLKLETQALDKTAVAAAEAALREADAGANATMLLVREPSLYEAQLKALDDGADVTSIVPMLAPTLRSVHATHLVLISKMRRNAAFETERSHVGQGKLEGVGFYIDRATRVDDRDDRTEYVGFLGPYAYFRVSLIDLDGPKLIGQKEIAATQTVKVNSATHPWDELDAAQKVAALQSILRSKIAEAVPQVVKPAR